MSTQPRKSTTCCPTASPPPSPDHRALISKAPYAGRLLSVDPRTGTQCSQRSACSRYSVAIASTLGTSMTWCLSGCSSTPLRPPPQQRHASGLSSCTVVTRSGGSIIRSCFLCPGCPPRGLPVGSRVLRSGADGASLDGGFDEFDEFYPSLAFSSATSRRSSSMSFCCSAMISRSSLGSAVSICVLGSSLAGCQAHDW